MNELPLAVQSALEESERRFSKVLSVLGLSRQELARLAGRIQVRIGTGPRGGRAPRTGAPERKGNRV